MFFVFFFWGGGGLGRSPWEEATVEAEHGPIFLSAAPSGPDRGGMKSFDDSVGFCEHQPFFGRRQSGWFLLVPGGLLEPSDRASGIRSAPTEALGIRLAVLGAACALSVPVSQGLETEATGRAKSLFLIFLDRCAGQVLRKAEVVVCPCRSNALEKSRGKHVATAEMCCPKQGLAKEGEGAEVRASLPEVSHQADAVTHSGYAYLYVFPSSGTSTYHHQQHKSNLPCSNNLNLCHGHQIIASFGTPVEAAAVLGRGGNVLIPIGADQAQRCCKLYFNTWSWTKMRSRAIEAEMMMMLMMMMMMMMLILSKQDQRKGEQNLGHVC